MFEANNLITYRFEHYNLSFIVKSIYIFALSYLVLIAYPRATISNRNATNKYRSENYKPCMIEGIYKLGYLSDRRIR